MKAYRSYTAKKLKLPKRILFFVICAVIFFVFAIILGNNLKKQMESAEIDRTPIETEADIETDLPEGIPDGNASHKIDRSHIKAGYLQLIAPKTDEDDEEKEINVKSAVDALYSKGFNAISFVAVEDSKLTYASRAAQEYSRLPANESMLSYEKLEQAVSYAKGKGMIATAVFEKGGREELDAAVVSELAVLGFDEIILSGFENLLGEKGGEISPCIEYIKKIRASAGGCAVSLILSPEAYTYARNSYQIEKLFSYLEFLSVDMSSLDAETAGELCGNISGSFSIYMLRPIVRGETTDVALAIASKSINTVQYISAIPQPDAETSGDETTNGDE